MLSIESTNTLDIGRTFRTVGDDKTNRDDLIRTGSKRLSIVLELSLKTDEQTDEISFVPEILRRNEDEEENLVRLFGRCRVSDERLPTLISYFR